MYILNIYSLIRIILSTLDRYLLFLPKKKKEATVGKHTLYKITITSTTVFIRENCPVQ